MPTLAPDLTVPRLLISGKGSGNGGHRPVVARGAADDDGRDELVLIDLT